MGPKSDSIENVRPWNIALCSSWILVASTAGYAQTGDGGACVGDSPQVVDLSQLRSSWASNDAGVRILGSLALSDELAGISIDASCFTTPNTPTETLVMRRPRIEAALRLLKDRISECRKVLDLPDFDRVLKKLNHTKISCATDRMVNKDSNSSKTRAIAQMTLRTQVGNRWVAAGTSDEAPAVIELNVQRDSTANGLDFDGMDIDSSAPSVSLENRASVLFHELLHTTSNSTLWHDSAHLRNETGCEDSVYADRIYLLTAACFPHSQRGVLLYDNARDWTKKCPHVCRDALGKIDADVSTLPDVQIDEGDSLVAIPLEPQAADAQCRKIEALSDFMRRREASIRQVRLKLVELKLRWTQGTVPPVRGSEVLIRRADSLLTWIYKYNQGFVPSPDAKAALDREIATWKTFRSIAPSEEMTQLLHQLDIVRKWTLEPTPQGVKLFDRASAAQYSQKSSKNPKLP